jgi:hypothetical protein
MTPMGSRAAMKRERLAEAVAAPPCGLLTLS